MSDDATTLLAALTSPTDAPATPPPAPAAPPQTPAAEAKPPEAQKPPEPDPDKVSKSLLALQRRESEIRRKERELEQREGALRTTAERVEATHAVLRDAESGKIDAAEAIDRIAKATGVRFTTKQLVEAVAKRGRVQPASAQDTAALDEVKKKLADLEDGQKAREREALYAQERAVIADVMKDGVRFEAMLAAGWTPQMVQKAKEQHFLATEEFLDNEALLDKIEKQEIERASRMRGLKKLAGGAPAGNGQETRATPAELTSGDGAAAQTPPATISQQLTGPGSRAVELPEPAWNDHEAWRRRAGLTRD